MLGVRVHLRFVIVDGVSMAHLLIDPRLRTSGCAVAESYIFNIFGQSIQPLRISHND